MVEALQNAGRHGAAGDVSESSTSDWQPGDREKKKPPKRETPFICKREGERSGGHCSRRLVGTEGSDYILKFERSVVRLGWSFCKWPLATLDISQPF